MSESSKPKKTKAELEQIIKSNGGKIHQSEHGAPNTVCVADRGKVYDMRCSILFIESSSGLVKVASLKKRGEFDIVRPLWIFDNIAQSESDGDVPRLLLPLEPRFALLTSFTIFWSVTHTK